MGTDCNLYGQRGDARQYSPPNSWAPEFAAIRDQGTPDYFGNVVPVIVLPDPPADAAAIQREIEYLLRLKQTERDRLMPNIREEMEGYFVVLERVLGTSSVAPADKPETFDLMDVIRSTARFWIMRSKARYNRPRPVQLERTLDPPFCPGHPAYPSGHSGESYSVALALMDATADYPELHGPLVAAAISIAWHREVAGVHYPSDSEASRRLARQLHAALRADAGYQQRITRVRAELRALMGPPR